MTTEKGSRPPVARALVAAVTAWLTVVALGSALVWAVISRAGDGVVASQGPAAGPAARAPRTPAGQEPSLGTPTSAGPTQRPSRPSSSATATPSAPGSTGSTGPVTTPGAGSGGPDPEPTGKPPGPSSAPPAASERRTWSGKGGAVTAECTGSKIKYVSAVPDNGYGFHVESNGPRELQVKFERNGGAEGETEVSGVCRNGVPQLRAEAGGADD